MTRWSRLSDAELDERLTIDLREFTADASRFDERWAARALLPAVRTAIARDLPERSRASRFAGFAGLAAVVAVLVLVIVALPRGVPGDDASPSPVNEIAVAPSMTPPTSGAPNVSIGPSPLPQRSPAANEVTVLTAAEFAEALRANELDRQQLVVDGGIVPGPPVPRPTCLPGVIDGHTCYLGELEGIDPPISVSAPWLATPESGRTARFDEPRIEWPHWWFPDTPVRGVMLLSVRGGTVEYIGRVRANGDALTWSVADAKALNSESLAPDEIVLVDGWLTGFDDIPLACTGGNDILPGLPNRYCSNPSWLMDSRSRSVHSAGDRASGIQLQGGAYHQFASSPDPQTPGTGDPVPRKGTYAVAPRLEGWCDVGDPPCWQWNVVGRVAHDLAGAAPRNFDCGYGSLLSRGRPSASATPISARATAISVRDETGLIEHCVASFAPSDSSGVLIENPSPNGRAIDVSWPGTMCDVSAEFTFRATDTGYELVGKTRNEPCPDGSLLRHAALLLLADGVPAESVRLSIDGATGAQPPPTPVPEAAVIPCTTNEHHATILDRTGFINACETVEGTVTVDSVTVLDHFDVGEIALRILWTGSACDDTPVFRLFQSGMRVTLEGELYGDPCGPDDVPFEVQLLLNTDLVAQVIDASMRRVPGPAPIFSPPGPLASAEIETELGTFEITARAGKSIYGSGEPIDITGDIVWNGAPGTTVEVFGGETDAAGGLVHFGWEQLDGDHLQVGPRFEPSCQPTVLYAGQPVTSTIAKETGNFGDKEHFAFWREFFATPEFMLPPGRYRVMARALFSVGECRDDRTILYVPIFINVTE